MAGFVGAKNGSGVYQQIICLIPPHETYVEPFVGTAAVYRNKRQARKTVLLDLSRSCIDRLGGPVPEGGPGAISYEVDGIRCTVWRFVGDGFKYLYGISTTSSRDVFVYADPPYVRSSRADPTRDYYEHEWDDAKHQRFLDLVDQMSCNVMISGYWSKLYGDRLRGEKWRTHSFNVRTRGGTATEWLWMNYETPTKLHDYLYIGGSFPVRWRIRKRQRNWLRAMAKMPELERRAMIAALIDQHGDAVRSYLGVDVAGNINRSDEPAGECKGMKPET